VPRPKLDPTPEQRHQVKCMAAFGIPHEDIATFVNIRSPKTLRKHFRQELDRGAIEANAKVGQTLFQMATSGSCPSATIFYLKSRAHWTEQPAPPVAQVRLPDFVVTQNLAGELK
jgi:hypothetical protein